MNKWSRKEMKSEARKILKKNFWIPLLICFLIAQLGLINSNQLSFRTITDRENYFNEYILSDNEVYYRISLMSFSKKILVHKGSLEDKVIKKLAIANDYMDEKIYEIIDDIIGNDFFIFSPFLFILGLFIISFLLLTLLSPLITGMNNIFLKAALNDHWQLNNMFFIFKPKNYAKLFMVNLVKNFIIFLYMLVFIIPGIIKSIRYTFVNYILADNPETPLFKALELSEKMTKKNLWKLIFLRLSFFGWYFLGNILFLIGVYFVIPYEEATTTQLYLYCRDQLIAEGIEKEIFQSANG